MSGIAAIVRFDGGDVEPGAIEAVTSAIDYRGPDGIRHYRQGPVALGHCMLHTTAESLEDTQPLANEDSSLVLVMDGWLSNWIELRAELLSKGARLRTRADAELVLRAYEAWGADCGQHIDGEFAIVIWDARRGEAFCLRDHAGLRPLHYHWDGDRLVVASDIAGVLAGPGVSAVPNPGMIAEIMGNEWIVADETVWLGVMRHPPAHWFRFGRKGRTSGKYWEPPHRIGIIYRSDEEYFEHYRALFADCVQRSSRTHLPLACEVSGGLDSSAIFCMAHHLLTSGCLQAPSLKGYTLRFEDYPGTLADEIEYGRAVGAQLGTDVKEVPAFMPDLAWFEARARADRDFALYPNGAMSIGLGKALVDDGCRVVFNGIGGDEWLTGSPLYFAEQLAAGDWQACLRSLREDAAEIGMRDAARRFVRFGVVPLAPRKAKDISRNFLSDRRDRRWLSHQANALLERRREARKCDRSNRKHEFGRSVLLDTLHDTFNLLARDTMSRMNARIGMEARSLMQARKFIEFSFATPDNIKLRGETRKYVHRNALDKILPDVLTVRKGRANFEIVFSRHFEDFGRVLLDQAPGGVAGCLDREGVYQLYEKYRLSQEGAKPVWELWGVWACENLLRQCLSPHMLNATGVPTNAESRRP